MAPKGKVELSQPEVLQNGSFVSKETGNYVPENVLNDYRTPVMGEAYVGLLGDNFKEQPLLQRLNWFHVPLLVGTPFLAIYGLLTMHFYLPTVLFTVAYFYLSGFGITAGYHRLWAHRAYKAHTSLKLVLLWLGTAAVEGSVRWWCRDHRAHHKYVDTEQDPYSAIKGFFYSHMGWMLVKQDPKKIGRASISDLSEDRFISFQHKYYLPLMLFAAYIFPTLVCGLGWGDYYGGFFFGGVTRVFFVHHSTFFVNSLAHFAGDATYTDAHTARNSIITALLTLGEGYHNFHHEFPMDYRNGIEWYQWDPTKVFIKMCSKIGIAYDLKEFPRNEIDKGMLQMKQKALDYEVKLASHDKQQLAKLEAQQKRLDQKKGQIFWGPDPRQLPVWTPEQVKKHVDAGQSLIILDGFVLNVADFMKEHPGGDAIIKTYIGKDVTAEFKHTYYKHSNAARNLASTYRVARISGYWS